MRAPKYYGNPEMMFEWYENLAAHLKYTGSFAFHSWSSHIYKLGLKPISLLISERKIRYVQNILMIDSRTSEIVNLLMVQELA